MPRSIYLMGSLRNPKIPSIAASLRLAGHFVFDDWFAAGPDADVLWRDYEIARGRDFLGALQAPFGRKNAAFDREHIDAADTAVLVMPAGKSGHLELGYAAGAGKEAFILLDQDYDRWDVMYGLATGVFADFSKLKARLDCSGI